MAELSGLRDRALIGVMVYTFARVSAVTTMRVEDYFEHGKRAWLRLHDKGGKRHEVPCHHNLTEYLDVWIKTAKIGDDKKGPLFRAIRKENRLTENPMAQEDVLAMIKRRAAGVALPYSTCCHTFAPPASPLTYRTVEPSSMHSRSPHMIHLAPPSCMTAPRTKFLWTKSREYVSNLMPHPVFISYARKTSREPAEALHRELGGESGLAFLDTSDIDAGEQFPKVLIDALLDAKVIVVFADETYFNRWYCLRESRTALAPFEALLRRGGASEQQKAAALSHLVVALPQRGPANLLKGLPSLIRQGSWPSARAKLLGTPGLRSLPIDTLDRK